MRPGVGLDHPVDHRASSSSCRSRTARSARRSRRRRSRATAHRPQALRRPAKRLVRSRKRDHSARIRAGVSRRSQRAEQRNRCRATAASPGWRRPEAAGTAIIAMPAVMKSPRPPPPMNAASTAPEITCIGRGAQSGEDHRQRERVSSTARISRAVMPMPRAASTTSDRRRAMPRDRVDQDRRQREQRQREERWARIRCPAAASPAQARRATAACDRRSRR